MSNQNLAARKAKITLWINILITTTKYRNVSIELN